MKKSFENFINNFKNRIKEIFNSELSAKQIAINFTAGILIGLLIPIGLQTVAVLIFCALFRLNIVIVVFASLITNPFTLVFIYYSAFKVGDFFIRSGISWNLISNVLNNPELESIINLSFDSIKVIYTGLLIESLAFGTLTYFTVYFVAKHLKPKSRL